MKNRKRIIKGSISVILGIGMLIAFVILGNQDLKEVELTDGERFSESYKLVPEDNVFVFKSLKEINKVLETGSGIVFLGFPACQWCQYYAKYVNEVAKEMQITEIYYFDISHDRENNSLDYQKTVSLLGNNIPLNDQNQRRVYVPDLTIVKDGEILNHNNETATIIASEETAAENYWTEEKETVFKSSLRVMFQDLSPVCTSCNE